MRYLLAAAALSALLAGSPTSATTLIARSFPDLVREADGIVAGRVVEIVTRRAEDGSIYTYVTLGDLELIRGELAGGTLTLRQEGGTLEGETLRIPGAPTFRQGERVVVLVAGNGARPVPIAGWEQGLFRVVRDQATGRELVTDALGNRVLGLSDGELLKERRARSEAELLGGPDRSASTGGSLGRTETGEVTPAGSGQEAIRLGAVAVGEPVDYATFLRELRELAEQMPTAASGRLTSADPAAPPRRAAQADTVPQPPATTPLAAPVPGELPRRLEIPPPEPDGR